jgi:hypothetical protein
MCGLKKIRWLLGLLVGGVVLPLFAQEMLV